MAYDSDLFNDLFTDNKQKDQLSLISDAQPESENYISDFSPTMLNIRTETCIQDSLNYIMSEIRPTKLKYAIKETPFSIYITFRKSFNKAKITELNPENEIVPQPGDIPNLLSHCKFLEEANDALKHMMEDEVIQHEDKVKAKALSEERSPCKLNMRKCVQKTRSSRIKMKSPLNL